MRTSPRGVPGSQRLSFVTTIPDPFAAPPADEGYPAGWRRKIEETIEKYGVTIIHIGSGSCDVPGCDHPPEPLEEQFGYTVGLTELGHPELRIDGYTSVETIEILNRTYSYIARGGESSRMRPGQTYALGNEDGTWSTFEIHDIGCPDEEVLRAADYYAEWGWPQPVEALRLIPR